MLYVLFGEQQYSGYIFKTAVTLTPYIICFLFQPHAWLNFSTRNAFIVYWERKENISFICKLETFLSLAGGEERRRLFQFSFSIQSIRQLEDNTLEVDAGTYAKKCFKRQLFRIKFPTKTFRIHNCIVPKSGPTGFQILPFLPDYVVEEW